MHLVHAASDVIRNSRMLRALAIASMVSGMGAEAVGASWELRIEIPGVTFLRVDDISSNRRFAVGSYCGSGLCSNFFWDHGELSTISIPGAEQTYLGGVNAAGDIVGHTWSPGAGEFAFLRARDGTITPISCPFATSVRPAAINNAGTVVGVAFTEGGDSSDGFRWRGGRCERLPITGGYIFPSDISANGIIVGTAVAGELEPLYAFLIRRNEVIVVEHPEAPFENGGSTALSAVAPNGLALGSWSPDVAGAINGNIGWFVFRDGVFEPVAVPPGDPRELTQLSISSSGVITYADSEGVVRSVRVTSALADQ